MSNTQNDDQGKPGPLPGEVAEALDYFYDSVERDDGLMARRISSHLTTLQAERDTLNSWLAKVEHQRDGLLGQVERIQAERDALAARVAAQRLIKFPCGHAHSKEELEQTRTSVCLPCQFGRRDRGEARARLDALRWAAGRLGVDNRGGRMTADDLIDEIARLERLLAPPSEQPNE